MRRSWLVAMLAASLGAATAHAAASDPASPTASVAGKPAAKPRAAHADQPAALAGQLTSLVFDANPADGIPPRDVLSRWAGPMRLLVFGRPDDERDVAAAARSLAGATRLPIDLLTPAQVRATPPNSFVVVEENLPGAFAGPLRAMLSNAFLDDDALVDAFIANVVAIQPCWTLPVWTDRTRTIIKAAIIGIDAKLPRGAVQRCMIWKLAAGLGLLGPSGTLTASVFAPQYHGTALSAADIAMLRAFYGPGLRVGMDRQAGYAAALAALGARPAPTASAPTTSATAAAGSADIRPIAEPVADPPPPKPTRRRLPVPPRPPPAPP